MAKHMWYGHDVFVVAPESKSDIEVVADIEHVAFYNDTWLAPVTAMLRLREIFSDAPFVVYYYYDNDWYKITNDRTFLLDKFSYNLTMSAVVAEEVVHDYRD